MVATLVGPLEWSMSRDDEGHREYKLVNLVKCSSKFDGPSVAVNCPGLPIPGSLWIIGNDLDVWAWCRWDATVTPRLTKEPNYYFEVEQKFGTKPLDIKRQRCNDVSIEDPLLEPQRISGSYNKYTEEAFVDRYGNAIVNSAFEQIRGPHVEFDRNRPSIRIEQNVAILGIEVFGRMIDTVNNSTLWGLPPRCVKLSSVSWERKFYGQCYKYYTRTLEFDINLETFDRVLLDEGTKVLSGKWGRSTGEWELVPIIEDGVEVDPNPLNPSHFIRFEDRQGNHSRVILNGFGLPANVWIPLPDGRTDYYVSIASPNLNKEITNSSYWIPLSGYQTLDPIQAAILGNSPITSDLFVQHDPNESYAKGNIVFDVNTDDAYVAITNVPENPIAPTQLNNVLFWAVLSEILSYEGEYSTATSYNKGSIVTYTGDQTYVGSIRVEKYPESNFLLLGIPLVL